MSVYELRTKHRRWRLFLSLFIASKGHQSQWFMAQSVNVWCGAEVPLNELILNINQDHIRRAVLVNGSLCLMTTLGDNPVRMTSRVLEQSVGMTSSPSTSSHVEMTKKSAKLSAAGWHIGSHIKSICYLCVIMISSLVNIWILFRPVPSRTKYTNFYSVFRRTSYDRWNIVYVTETLLWIIQIECLARMNGGCLRGLQWKQYFSTNLVVTGHANRSLRLL